MNRKIALPRLFSVAGALAAGFACLVAGTDTAAAQSYTRWTPAYEQELANQPCVDRHVRENPSAYGVSCLGGYDPDLYPVYSAFLAQESVPAIASPGLIPDDGIKQVAQENRTFIRENRAQIVQNSENAWNNYNRIRSLQTDVDELREGVAIAVALDAPSLSADKKFSLSVGYGHFEGGNAMAVGGVVRVREDIFLSLGGGLGLDETSGAAKAVLTFER